MTPAMTRRQGGIACAVLVFALIATGCRITDPYQPTAPDDAAKAADTLTTLPSLEDTRTQVEAAIVTLGQQITAIAPTANWEWQREYSRAGCLPPFEQSDGEVILMPKYVSSTPIREQHWQQAYDLAVEAAHSIGADNLTVFKDNPNDHDVQFTSDTGTTLRFGSQAAALITGSTGCRLPAK
ncbi:LppA family lipoprotein [Mycobacterium sp. SMC-4]|uniref:LppA family lipoprotein n=1 Tax=Mycobacterium sp. SMC-4 TaxID=2857059 RepID=UPI003D056A0C